MSEKQTEQFPRSPRSWWHACAGTAFLPVLRGSGQMLFQPSALTGGLFLVLIASQSIPALAGCLAGIAGSTLCAYALERPGEAYFEGEGGFNGGLLGLALAVFYQFNVALLPMAFFGGVLTGLVRVGLLRVLPVPPFTAPFVLVAWPVFGVAGLLSLIPAALPTIDPWPHYAPVTNASQVLFILHPWVGVLVFIAVLSHSRVAAVWVAVASVVAWLTAILLDLPAGLTSAGLLGYNAMILGAALQHRGTHWSLFAAGVVATVLLYYSLHMADIIPLSAPFVLSAWLVIAVERMLTRRGTTTS